MTNNQKNKQISVESNNFVLDAMMHHVEEKLDACKGGLPLIFTMITSLLAFLLLANFESKNVMYLAIPAAILLMVALVSLLLTYCPRAMYKESKLAGKKKKGKNFEFDPSNIKSYLNLTRQQFVESLQQYLGKELTVEQKLQADLLKNKADEYNYKQKLLKVSYGVLIGGTLTLIAVFATGLFLL